MNDTGLRAEAERLVTLDEKGLKVEAVYQSLRLGRFSEEASAELNKLDHEFLNEITGRETAEPS